jgi:hypothetical protein
MQVSRARLVPPLRTGRLASPALRFIVLFLFATAFAWGLQVKISQYSSAQVHDRTVAKFVQD